MLVIKIIIPEIAPKIAAGKITKINPKKPKKVGLKNSCQIKSSVPKKIATKIFAKKIVNLFLKNGKILICVAIVKKSKKLNSFQIPALERELSKIKIKIPTTIK